MLSRTGKLDFFRGTIVNAHLRKEGINPSTISGGGTRLQLMQAAGSTCAHTGCSAGCSDGYGCGGGGDNPTVGFTCGC